MASAELRDTRRRIKSVQSTMKITRAMELISASRIPKATARVNASKPYAEKLVEVISNVSGASGGASHMLLEERELNTVGILVFASDRGLAGAYASTVIRMAERKALEYLDQGKAVRFFAVGKKAQAYFEYRKYQVERSFIGSTDAPGFGDARAISNAVLDAYARGAIDSLEVVYTQFRSASTQEAVMGTLLPLSEIGDSDDDAPKAAVDYVYEPSPAEILDRLLPRYVEATIFSMLLEAAASEHSARRRAMKAATDNAEDLIRALTTKANRARQAEITTEISEIVGGAEALSQG